MQSRQNILALLETEAIEITSTDNNYPFKREEQIGSDSIDLRIGDYFFTMRDNIEYVNTLNISDNFCKELFIQHEFISTGYILQPQEIIFIPTLERIHMKTPRFYGYVSGRSIYSRMGISVHCTMTKFGFGMNSIVSLQIVNNSPTPLKIFPRQKIAQLEIHEIYGSMSPYDGRFSREEVYLLPATKGKESEFSSYTDNEIRIILNDKNKFLTKNRKPITNLEKLNLYFKTKKLVGSIIGIGGLLSFFILYAQNPNPYILGLFVLSLLLTIDFIYCEIVFTKGVDIDE